MAGGGQCARTDGRLVDWAPIPQNIGTDGLKGNPRALGENQSKKDLLTKDEQSPVLMH